MARYTGFNDGCSGVVRTSPAGYGGFEARFETEGRPLASTLTGQDAEHGTRPDSIRIVAFDDYDASTYKDRVLAFSDEAARNQLERADGHIPAGDIAVLSDDDVDTLNRACERCDLTEGNCPVLSGVLEQTISISPVTI